MKGLAHDKGFTLLELLVSLLVMALAMSVVAPRFTAALTTAGLKSETRRVAAMLRLSRSMAITQGHQVAFKLDQHAYTFGSDDRTYTEQWPAGIHVQLAESTSGLTGEIPRAIRFFPDGGSTGGQVVLSADTLAYAVDVDWLTGRVTISD